MVHKARDMDVKNVQKISTWFMDEPIGFEVNTSSLWWHFRPSNFSICQVRLQRGAVGNISKKK